jgi:hypothetical protein
MSKTWLISCGIGLVLSFLLGSSFDGTLLGLGVALIVGRIGFVKGWIT